MIFSPLLQQLIDALRILPGVGPKSAQRMAFYLLERQKDGAKTLGQLLQQAVAHVGKCRRCRILSEKSLCLICSNPERDQELVCIVESPADVAAIEHTRSYQGVYFVLSGHLSPIDGRGPEEVGITELITYLKEFTVKEVILATNFTVEGEATAFYIADILKSLKIAATRIAHGVPWGGELGYVNDGTLAKALAFRSEV